MKMTTRLPKVVTQFRNERQSVLQHGHDVTFDIIALSLEQAGLVVACLVTLFRPLNPHSTKRTKSTPFPATLP